VKEKKRSSEWRRLGKKSVVMGKKSERRATRKRVSWSKKKGKRKKRLSPGGKKKRKTPRLRRKGKGRTKIEGEKGREKYSEKKGHFLIKKKKTGMWKAPKKIKSSIDRRGKWRKLFSPREEPGKKMDLQGEKSARRGRREGGPPNKLLEQKTMLTDKQRMGGGGMAKRKGPHLGGRRDRRGNRILIWTRGGKRGKPEGIISIQKKKLSLLKKEFKRRGGGRKKVFRSVQKGGTGSFHREGKNSSLANRGKNRPRKHEDGGTKGKQQQPY